MQTYPISCIPLSSHMGQARPHKAIVELNESKGRANNVKTCGWRGMVAHFGSYENALAAWDEGEIWEADGGTDVQLYSTMETIDTHSKHLNHNRKMQAKKEFNLSDLDSDLS